MRRRKRTLVLLELVRMRQQCKALQQIKTQLQGNETLYRFLAEQSTDVIWRLDEQLQFTYVSPAVTRVFGYRPEEVTDRSLFSVLTARSGEEIKKQFAQRAALQAEKQQWGSSVYTVEALRKDGSGLWAEVTVNPVFGEENRLLGYIGIMRDISERHRHEELIWQYAFYDELTNLPNRRLFEAVLERAVSRKTQFEEAFAVLFLDVDNFKHVNDAYGHAAGDELLRVVAERLCRTVRKDDFVARLAGDEFVAILSGCGDHAAVQLVVERLLEVCRQPIKIGSHKINVGVSAGISFCPADTEEPDKLLLYADQAMYGAKRAGGGRYVCYVGSGARPQ